MLKKIKIVYLIGQLGLGGSERQLYLLLKHFDPQKADISVVVFNPSPYVTLNHAIELLGFQVFAIPENNSGILKRLIYIYRLLRQLSPDIVHSWTIHDNPYAGIAGSFAGVPVRWGSARDSILAKGFYDLPAIYQWLSLRSVDKLMVNAESIRAELLEKRLPLNRIKILSNCVQIANSADGGSVLPDLTNLGIPDGKKLVGLVGNIRKKKNHLMFVDAMSQVLLEHPDTYGLIVGQPIPDEMEYHRILKKKVAESSLAKRIFFVGFRDDIPALMRRLTLFCLTSDYEGTPNVILEAMSAARPVVATSVGGIPDIVQDGVSGLLVAPGDVDRFAKAVCNLLDDPVLAENMGLAGRQIVETRYSCGQIVQQLLDLYREAVNEKN